MKTHLEFLEKKFEELVNAFYNANLNDKEEVSGLINELSIRVLDLRLVIEQGEYNDKLLSEQIVHNTRTA